MRLNRITTGTVALLLGAVLLLGVGTYTENGGLQLAGGILLVVAVITALNQARSSRDE